MLVCSGKKIISWVRLDLSPLELHPATELLYQLQVTDEWTLSSHGMVMYKGRLKY